MELRELNLTVEDIVKNLNEDRKTREYVLSKAENKIPKEGYSKNIYYAFRDAMCVFLSGILKERCQLEELKNNQENADDMIIINSEIDSREIELDNALEKLGKEVIRYEKLREKMRFSSNEKRLELFLQGVDYSVLDIKFEGEV